MNQKTASLPDIAKIASGAMNELFQSALGECVMNIVDVNRKATAERRVTIELTLKPVGEDRDIVRYGVDVKTKLAPRKTYNSQMFVDVVGGKPHAVDNKNPRQTDLVDNLAQMENAQQEIK